MTMGYSGKLLDVEHAAARIGDGFAKQSLRVRTEGSADFLVACLLTDEGTVDSELAERHPKEVIGATIDLVRGHNVVASLTDVEHGKEVGCLSTTGEHGPHSTFQRGNLSGHSIVGGVLQTRVEVTFLLQVEEVGHFLCVIILERGALVDGEHARFAILRLPARLHAQGCRLQLILHENNSFDTFFYPSRKSIDSLGRDNYEL